MLLDVLLDACVDTLKLVPFLFATYLFMEWLEHGVGARFASRVSSAGRFGPLVGAFLGVVPQCGFSGAAATLYAGRVVTLGTLFAVFLATSDEMLPVMLSSAVAPALIFKVLAVKVVAGLVFGFAVDAMLRARHREHAGLADARLHEGHGANDIHVLCEREGCECTHCGDCEECAEQFHEDCHGHDCGHRHAAGHGDGHGHGHSHGCGHNHSHGVARDVVFPAVRHTLHITLFIFVVTLAIGLVVESGFGDVLGMFGNVPFASEFFTSVLGLVPNCAISVAYTQLYLDGLSTGAVLMNGGALVAGLTANAGIGLLVLFRTNRSLRENLSIAGLLVAMGVVTGWVVELLALL